LIDENKTIGKEGTMTHGNSVLSMIDWAM